MWCQTVPIWKTDKTEVKIEKALIWMVKTWVERLHIWTLTILNTKMLSNNKNIDLNVKDIREKTFFMNACINGHKDVVRLPFSKCDLRVLEVGWVFHHLLCARWWETHLYVIIIKYQNDLRLVSHSNHSSAKFWGPMKFSIIVPSSSS